MQNEKKPDNWLYALRTSICSTLLTVVDNKNRSLPAKIRQELEDTILKKFVKAIDGKIEIIVKQ